jgi:hypothetical protein
LFCLISAWFLALSRSNNNTNWWFFSFSIISCFCTNYLSFFRLLIFFLCSLFSCSNCFIFDCKSWFLVSKYFRSEFLGLFSTKILSSWWILMKIFQLFSKIIFLSLFSIGFGGSCGVFPSNHLSVINFSQGSWVDFQYKTVVRILEWPRTCWKNFLYYLLNLAK